MQKQQLVYSALIASSITILFVVLITIAGELYKVVDATGKTINPIKDFLKSLHGHHWVGKSYWAIALFVVATAVLYALYQKCSAEQSLLRGVRILTLSLILGTLALYGFFTYEYLMHH